MTLLFIIFTEKEKILFSNKLNKLVTLVKKATKDKVVDELAAEIDHEIQ